MGNMRVEAGSGVPWRDIFHFALANVKPRANGRDIVGQKLPKFLDVTCFVRLHILLHVTTCCWEFNCCAKFETSETSRPTTLNSSFVPWSPKCSATMWDPFAQLFQHCWDYASSLYMVSKVLLIGCGSCCICLHTTANKDATTSNIVGASVYT